MEFKELGIIEPILKALQLIKYQEATPIQVEAIPLLLKGNDQISSAQTGTGKTAAFAIPILQKIYLSKSKNIIKALILTPTRELASQIAENLNTYKKFLNLKSFVIFGGVSPKSQIVALKQGLDILVATPGRLLDLSSQGLINLTKVEYFVLDEADQMLDMGFIHDVRRIIKMLPSKRQTILFSATMPPEIEKLAQEILINPQRISVAPVSQTLEQIKQYGCTESPT